MLIDCRCVAGVAAAGRHGATRRSERQLFLIHRACGRCRTVALMMRRGTAIVCQRCVHQRIRLIEVFIARDSECFQLLANQWYDNGEHPALTPAEGTHPCRLWGQ